MELKKIKMLKDFEGSQDGINVEVFKKNEEYSVKDALYKAFVIQLKVAEPVNNVIEDLELKKAEVPENKAIKIAPENKEVKTEEKEIEKEIDSEKEDVKDKEEKPKNTVRKNKK